MLESELNKIILRDVEVPGALITITRVEVSSDLKQMKVGVSTLPSEKSGNVLKTLEGYKKSFAKAILKKTRLRGVPEMTFENDEGPARAAAIEKKMFDEGISGKD